MNWRAAILSLLAGSSAMAALPSSPKDSQHPGSQIYQFGSKFLNQTCNQRAVSVFLPEGATAAMSVPVVVYGHGQALGLENYRATFEHLAKKGVAVIFPTYDTGFFDQNWSRMGSDFRSLTDCILKQTPVINPDWVVFSGHSKGAYVASIAAGQAFGGNGVRPKSVVLFEPAGADEATLPQIASSTALTVIFSDADTVVKESLSRTIFERAGSSRKQFIHFKSYTAADGGDLRADHFWPLTKGSAFGGGEVSAFHYYGAWKWLVAAAQDLQGGARFDNPYLYGPEALDKGAVTRDDVERK